jgi:hypothetical protein
MDTTAIHHGVSLNGGSTLEGASMHLVLHGACQFAKTRYKPWFWAAKSANRPRVSPTSERNLSENQTLQIHHLPAIRTQA